MAIQKEVIRDFQKRVIGYIETDVRTGNKKAFDFYHRKLGSYDKKLNVSRDFYNRKIGDGDMMSMLIWDSYSKKNSNVQ